MQPNLIPAEQELRLGWFCQTLISFYQLNFIGLFAMFFYTFLAEKQWLVFVIFHFFCFPLTFLLRRTVDPKFLTWKAFKGFVFFFILKVVFSILLLLAIWDSMKKAFFERQIIFRWHFLLFIAFDALVAIMAFATCYLSPYYRYRKVTRAQNTNGTCEPNISKLDASAENV